MWDNVHFSPKCNSSEFLSMKAIPDLLVSRDIKNLRLFSKFTKPGSAFRGWNVHLFNMPKSCYILLHIVMWFSGMCIFTVYILPIIYENILHKWYFWPILLTGLFWGDSSMIGFIPLVPPLLGKISDSCQAKSAANLRSASVKTTESYGKIGIFSIWMFPKIGIPQNGWIIMENPFEMDDLGVPPFKETPNWIAILATPMAVNEIPNTVDGSEIPNNHLGWCWNPIKQWDILHINWLAGTISSINTCGSCKTKKKWLVNDEIWYFCSLHHFIPNSHMFERLVLSRK